MNELVPAVESTGFGDDVWPPYVMATYATYKPGHGSDLAIDLVKPDCYSALLNLDFNFDKNGNLADATVWYFSVDTDCLGYEVIHVEDVDVDCESAFTVDEAEEPGSMRFEFTDCQINVLDACPLDENGDCYDGPEVSRIVLAGVYEAEMQRLYCR